MKRVPHDKDGNAISPPAINIRPDVRYKEGAAMKMVSQIRKYKLITPMFGGGAEPMRADHGGAVRATGIRGQLRFWWRATRSAAFDGDLKAMKNEEDLLWGAASLKGKARPSLVDVVVTTTSKDAKFPKPYKVVSKRRRDGTIHHVSASNAEVAHPYIAFPLQPTSEELKAKGMRTQVHPVVKNVTFDMHIFFPEEHRADVEAALWAWETFGGVGGRTRRGFGAVQLVKVNNDAVVLKHASEMCSVLKEGLRKHVSEGAPPKGVPYLSQAPRMVLTSARDCPERAWEHLVETLNCFRQKRRPGNGKKPPGRSKWPEPDAIRRVTGQHAPKHKEPILEFDKFPRAAFGLPIIFHFKDDREGDPKKTTLQGKDGIKRLASPLILRPLACDKQAVGLAVVLQGTGLAQMPGGPYLTGAGQPRAVDPNLTQDESGQIPPMGKQIDVIDAFLNFLKQKP